MENQNLILHLRAEITEQFDEFREKINDKFDTALKDLGYQGGTQADTAVPANPHDHPIRRTEDLSFRGKAVAFAKDNTASILLIILAIFASPQVMPYFHRIADALTKLLESSK